MAAVEEGGAAFVVIVEVSVVPKEVGVEAEVGEIVIVEVVVPASKVFKYFRKTMQT